ncbi:hypothetical protein MHBO_001120 [Bonamia ostreae]|uniref:Ribosomal RNA-processing protein 14/surfeit locus protein 6 C-terminal domain-containing protein n=1 Tax=Bonamia ostreae TaxID=126728 RepID=A0ABV2AHW1_9EUKA
MLNSSNNMLDLEDAEEDIMGHQFESSADGLRKMQKINEIVSKNQSYINELIEKDKQKNKLQDLRANSDLKRKQSAAEKRKEDIWDKAEKSSLIASEDRLLKLHKKLKKKRKKEKKHKKIKKAEKKKKKRSEKKIK